jgi:hypothetical protein
MDCLQSATIEVQAQTTGQEREAYPTIGDQIVKGMHLSTLLHVAHELSRPACAGVMACLLLALHLPEDFCDQPFDKHHLGA